MSNRLRSIVIAPLLASAIACSSTDTPPPAPPGDGGVRPDAAAIGDGGSVAIRLVNTATNPFAATNGDLSFVGNDLVLAATSTGILPVALNGARAGKTPAGWAGWALSSTGADHHPAASAIATIPLNKLAGVQKAAFLPAGKPQVGLLEVYGAAGMAQQGRVLTQAALTTALASPFPAALVAPEQGPAADALWVVDAPFGPGSAVRAFPYSSYNAGTHKLTEASSRRFSAVAEDLDGDNHPDTPILGRLIFLPAGDIGLVAFTVLNGLAGTTGGVYAFDASNGQKLGHLMVPQVSTATTTTGFVSSLAVSGDKLLVVSAEKGPMFSEVGGQLAIYQVESWRPFKVTDLDPAKKFDQPSHQLNTTLPGTTGVLAIGNAALLVDAPFFMNSDLDWVTLGDAPLVQRSFPFGLPYVQGNVQPGDPHLSPDGKVVLLGSEAGLIRLLVE